jgi:hypothetical protein
MAKIVDYTVSFYPAKRTEQGYYQINLSVAQAPERHVVSVSSLADLEREVRRLAVLFGQPCSPSVRVADRHARKPNGFDAWYKAMSIIDDGEVVS